MRLAAVEAGGTTFKVAIAVDSPENIVEHTTFPTTTPVETLNAVIGWLKERQFDAIGIASFGPVDLDESSPQFGFITTTPKPNWAYTDVLGALKRAFPSTPMQFDTDVNAPAIAEVSFGKHGPVKSCAYITVGTGVGVGIVSNGQCVHGLLHPEAGHIPVPRAPGDESFEPSCPFHKNGCIEGLVATGALVKRAGCSSSADLASLPDSHPVWETTAFYLAQLCATLTLVASPEVIVLGGGVPRRSCLFPMVRAKLLETLNGYIASKKILETPEQYIVASVFGDNAGIVGALELSRQAYIRINQ